MDLKQAIKLRWDFRALADQIGAIIQSAENDLRLEQAVHGLDIRDELQIQSLLATGLAKHFKVAREVHYPSSKNNKLTHRQRCDLVLTPPGRPLRLDSRPPTLFDAPNQADPAEALWLEVKIAYQFREGNQPHKGYGSQWRNAVVADLKKMEAEEFIRDAGLLLIVFNESQQILEKDLEIFETLLIQKEVLAGFRQSRTILIQDRIGHRVCTAALWPTIQR